MSPTPAEIEALVERAARTVVAELRAEADAWRRRGAAEDDWWQMRRAAQAACLADYFADRIELGEDVDVRA